MYMLCRNKVSDFTEWKRVFDSHKSAHEQAGLTLKHLWRATEQPDTVFFVFEVREIGRAKAFINAPESKQAGKESGVLEGDYHFVEDVKG